MKKSEQMNGKVGDIITYGFISDGIHYLKEFASYELKKGNNIS